MKKIASVVVIAALLAGCSSGPKDRTVDARSTCQEWVKQQLKAPGSADFGGQSATGSGQGPWTITGWVDAQNSFGAKLRTNWTCSVRLEGDTLKGSAKLT